VLTRQTYKAVQKAAKQGKFVRECTLTGYSYKAHSRAVSRSTRDVFSDQVHLSIASDLTPAVQDTRSLQQNNCYQHMICKAVACMNVSFYSFGFFMVAGPT
jgi:hypothetical protein